MSFLCARKKYRLREECFINIFTLSDMVVKSKINFVTSLHVLHGSFLGKGYFESPVSPMATCDKSNSLHELFIVHKSQTKLIQHHSPLPPKSSTSPNSLSPFCGGNSGHWNSTGCGLFFYLRVVDFQVACLRTCLPLFVEQFDIEHSNQRDIGPHKTSSTPNVKNHIRSIWSTVQYI